MRLIDVLGYSFEHFYTLDRANSAVRCGDVRYSWLTIRLAEQIDQLRGSGQAMLAASSTDVDDVLAHAPVEDTGR